jgi:hypothetical protein
MLGEEVVGRRGARGRRRGGGPLEKGQGPRGRRRRSTGRRGGALAEDGGALVEVGVALLEDGGVVGGAAAVGEDGEGPIRRTREGWSEWEPIKILLEGDGDSNKTNTASNTHLQLTTQVSQAQAATKVLLDLGTNKQPSEPKHTNTHSGNLHGLLPMLHQSDRWTAPVRPVATAAAQQA